ncbi:MAG TPA: ATP-binding protein [Candidatus Sulfotelmatobacter sp.]|nr:ATP-binding protein [Candidatus Sulfotelmatobacter sp.]
MGETRVDLHHLLEDLRDAYPAALEETILTEMVANSLDSGASRIRITADPVTSTLALLDDGSGMQRRELARYHDLAASAKVRGEGIGFAGVGIKLGLLACEAVLTETRRGKTHVATRWHLASRHRAPWKWTPPPGLVEERGTAVRLILRNALSLLLDAGFLEGTLRRQYQPLLDPAFDEILAPTYPRGIRLEVNERVLEREGRVAAESAPLEVRLARKRKPSAVGYLVRETLPLPEDRRGVAISTLGKVIKRGWDWLGVTPEARDRIGGLIEAPALAACLTLNKGDFIRVGARGAIYLAYRKAIQEAVSRQLTAWGDVREAAVEARRRVVRPLERDLERVLLDLAEAFPLLVSLVERRAGGQKRLPMGRGEASAGGYAPTLTAAPPATVADGGATEGGPAGPPAEAAMQGEGESPSPTPAPGPPASGPPLPEGRGPQRPQRYGLGIQFESRSDDLELGRLVESTVFVNDAHPAYRRAVASRSEGYHIALAVALALAPLAAEAASEHEFVTAFLTRWGEALDRRKGGPRHRR